jgi:uncharacterized protein YndB with AHSA1/START domain
MSDRESAPGTYETVVELNAPVEEVFRHLTDPAAMICWMGQHATLEAVPGGAFEVDINGVPVRGRYLEIDPPHRVVVSWGVAGSTKLPPGRTQVEFTLTTSQAARRSTVIEPLPTALFGQMADGLDIVAVRVADERAVVVLVVLRPHPGLVQHLGAEAASRLEERVHRVPG